MDKMDERIIEILKKDGRAPFVDIAKKLKTSEGTIRGRVKRMMDRGEIKGFCVKTTSKDVKAIVEIKIDLNVNTSDISSRIGRMNGVEHVYEVSGEEDIVVIVNVMSATELNDVIESIRRLDNTLATRTRLVLKET